MNDRPTKTGTETHREVDIIETEIAEFKHRFEELERKLSDPSTPYKNLIERLEADLKLLSKDTKFLDSISSETKMKSFLVAFTTVDNLVISLDRLAGTQAPKIQ